MRKPAKGELPKKTPQYRTCQRRIAQIRLINKEPSKGEMPKATFSI